MEEIIEQAAQEVRRTTLAYLSAEQEKDKHKDGVIDMFVSFGGDESCLRQIHDAAMEEIGDGVYKKALVDIAKAVHDMQTLLRQPSLFTMPVLPDGLDPEIHKMHLEMCNVSWGTEAAANEIIATALIRRCRVSPELTQVIVAKVKSEISN